MRTEDVTALVQDVCERVILPRYRSLAADEVDEKRPGDLVTIADREAEVELTAAFRAATPRALVVGEEATFVDATALAGLGSAEHAWVIDPVDGTRNFASGTPDFGVIVAEVRSGVTTRGWIWQPLHDELYVAERGAGATRNGTPLARLAPGPQPWGVAAWPKARHARIEGMRLRPTKAACAIDYPMVSRGEIQGLAYRSIHPWDHLAGCLLVTELGGTASVDGRAYHPGVTGRLLSVGASAAIAEAVGTGLGVSG